jgi:hypothetical protein
VTPPHLLRVTEGPERFAPLIAAIQTLDLRVGWLDLAPPPPVPGDLETAAGLGTLRAVAAGGGRAVVVKPLRGEPVLGDLLREHFRGCVLVLVRGEVVLGDRAAPLLQLEESGERWTVTVAGEAARAFASADLAEALRSPRPPWAPPLPPRPPREQKKKRVKKTKQEKKRERIERRKKKPQE